MAVWIDGTVTIAAKREADGPVRVVQDVGAVRPIYCTAVGKAPGRRGCPGPRCWRHSPQTSHGGAHAQHHHHPGKLSKPSCGASAMPATRSTTKSNSKGLRCIAMPVFCYTGEVIACMCVLGPKQRMTHQKLVVVRTPLPEFRDSYPSISDMHRPASADAPQPFVHNV